MTKPASPGLGYRLLSLCLYPLWMLHGLRHGRKNGLAGYFSMRLRGCAGAVEARIWVHCASVGEVRAVTPLVHALLARGAPVLLTSFTATGYRTIVATFGDSVSSCVIPIESPWHCRRFFRHRDIGLGLIMETELWPELLYQARRHGVDLVQINARLSRKSLDTGSFIRRILARTLGYFDAILTRSERDRDALTSLGAEAGRIHILGNLKSHIELPQAPKRLLERDYLLLASSHAGEEERFLEACPEDLEAWLLVLAPRHPDRGAALQTWLERLGIRHAVRSKAQALQPDTRVYLADTLGELQALMAHARVVVMGGSFDDTGGHNLIEPAGLGCAILTGPADANIVEDIAMLGQGDGVLQVEDMPECWREIRRLLQDPDAAARLGRSAQARLAQQPDIVQSYLAALRPYLD